MAQMAYADSSTSFLARTVPDNQSRYQLGHVGTGPVSRGTKVPSDSRVLGRLLHPSIVLRAHSPVVAYWVLRIRVARCRN